VTRHISFTLGESKVPIIGTEKLTTINFEDGQLQGYEVRGDTLLLFDQCYDCYSHTYKRK
jgi:hypothetical protein